MTNANQRMPVVFLPHGGGPWPFVKLGFGSDAEQAGLAGYLRAVRDVPATPPRALLVISAHWEEPQPTVMNGTAPPLLFDYYGFPPESYELTWPAPGEPALAARVQALLGAAGIPSAANDKRGFDHGTFVPLKLAYPDAEIPTVQLSLKAGLDPREHLAIGRALAPLRDEGVFIIGSGMTYHNMRAMARRVARPPPSSTPGCATPSPAPPANATPPSATGQRLPPRAPHTPVKSTLIPLMVVAGAAGNDNGRVAYQARF